MTLSPSSTPSAGRAEPVDIRDMVAAHQAMRREFRLTAAAVERTGDGDRRQAGRVAAHIRTLITMLEHHHEGEDRLLWPKLSQRVPGQLAATVVAMQQQHETIHRLLGGVAAQTTTWERQPGVRHRTQLAQTLLQLCEALDQHLDAEERDLLPLASAHLSLEEWKELEDDGIKAMPKRQLAFVSGMTMYHADPACLAVLLDRAPAPVRLFASVAGPRSYARRARRIHGTGTP